MNMRISSPRWRTLGGRMSWLLFLAAGVASCSDSEPATPCFCTVEFRVFPVRVTDAAGQPAEGVSISVRRVSDAAVLTEIEDFFLAPGVYVILPTVTSTM